MSLQLETLRAEDQISALDVHFARAMGRLGSDEQEGVLLAAALVSHQVTRGHVCLDIRHLSAESLGIRADLLQLPPPEEWLMMLRASRLVSDGGAKTPLVLDEHGWLYLHRYWNHERVLARYILKRAEEDAGGIDDAVLAEGLQRLFPAAGDDFDYQRLAALMAVRRRFCVVSGGPGTGKTHTVVNILALLIEQARATAQPLPHVTLVAPTGKAAARLVESIKKSKASLACDDEVKAAIVEKASTIHRCLVSVDGSSTEFRHSAQNPLVTDVVLLDEASMVNLGLMRRLVEALPPRARLILLGDMDQLASVEAGAVLGDICNTGSARSYSQALRDDIQALGGPKLPEAAMMPTATGIWDCVAKLHKSYRFQGEAGIAALAKAIHVGDASGAMEVLERFDDVHLVAPGKAGKLSGVLRAAAISGYRSYLQPGEPGARLRAFDTFRILCARRTGAFGVERVNEQIASALGREKMIAVGPENYEGRPIMITANTYELQLYNGDIGLVLPDSDTGHLRAFFVAADGSQRKFAPSRLPHQETVFAMSVHKSQGSEFDEIAVVLPSEPSPLLTRELIYTAVTRAKKRVVIHGSAEILRYAIERPTVRHSGLRPALWGIPGA